MATFAVLGAVEMSSGGHRVCLGHAKQRVVLAALLVEANRAVTRSELADRLWGQRPPPGGPGALYSYLSRLRAVLARAGGASIERGAGGYRLRVPEHSIDLHRFQDLLPKARAERDEDRAVALFEQALSLWRDEFCAGIDLPWFNARREVLHAQRLLAQLDHADLALRQGRHCELLPALASRAASHPFDERAAAQLMVALCQSGRQAEALHRFAALRTRLVEELGVEPGAPLRQLHRRILCGLSPQPAAWGWRGRTAHATRGLPAGVHSKFQ
ncbi:AfsR/SARP family transcriptional regulator [Crossiella sp. CA-258035]|uniref:AfsR/SARP family transcriptional regulator n=1 Tax=Crossiella sp. CA-258035 TaxID=2981138 RepID=UPI0024BC4A5A|nr:AfsR/SARP family transcriptional regulator [Crossiella sp. CA-258035]WHT16538.1 AfsR/SARP family transcriptional regulator [Crossiella sp. CA-258035]